MKHWIMAARLRTLPAAIAPVLLGGVSVKISMHSLRSLLF